ncbi:TPA: hypothetical protein ACUNF5_005267 [Burkholderia orbicola]
MKLFIVGEEGYVYLTQLWRGDITVQASPSAKTVVQGVVDSLGGSWHPQHSNWVVAAEKSLALFEGLYDLSVRNDGVA